tara:strand:- start:330 stop:1376 length:1047 start_codon:yes stop_codon:yes gene_type:complete
MNLKNYLVIDYAHEDNNMFNYKLTIIKGFKNDELSSALSDNPWKPNSNEVVYFYKGCNVPRFKVRDKFKVTIKPEKATSSFMGSIPANSKLGKGISRTMNVDAIKEHVIDFVMNNMKQFVYLQNKISIYESMFKYINIDHVLLADSVWGNAYFDNYLGESLGSYVDKNTSQDADYDLSNSWNYSRKKADKECNTLIQPSKELISLADAGNVYSENDMLSVLNEDQMTINYDKFVELCSYFETRQEDDTTLAMEIMSNSDFTSSALYILILLSNYKLKMKNNPGVKHVNFKGLLNYFNYSDMAARKNRWDWLQTTDITDKLKEKDLYTQQVSQDLSEIIMDGNYYNKRE